MDCGLNESALSRPARFALHDAAEANDAALLLKLLTAPASADGDIMDVNERDPAGCTPLHVAILNGAGEVLPVLLTHGASLKARCNGSPVLHTLLAMTALRSNAAFVSNSLQLLLALEVDLSALDDSSRTWLHIAATLNQPHIADTILSNFERRAKALRTDSKASESGSAGTDSLLAATDKAGYTPLHAAAAAKSVQMAEWLLSKGLASVTRGTARGDTPGHLAARAGWWKGWMTLLQRSSAAVVAPLSSESTTGALSKDAMIIDDVSVQTWSSLRNFAGDTPLQCAAEVAGEHDPEGAPFSSAYSDNNGSCSSSNSSSVSSVHSSLSQRRNSALSTDVHSSSSSSGSSSSSTLPRTAQSNERHSSNSSSGTTLLLTHEVCAEHHTCDRITRRTLGVPPENTLRLNALLSKTYGSLRATEFESLELVFGAPRAMISDILRVHEYEYVRKILCAVGQTHALAAQKQQRSAAAAAAAASSSSPSSCDVTHHHRLDTSSSSAAAPSDVSLHHLDSDTAVSQSSWEAALRAAGAVCAAADRVIAGRNVNAFCPIRPPGHHAGPSGVVPNTLDAIGTHGFCLLNNVAVAAAYVRNVYGRPRASYAAALDWGIPHENHVSADVSASSASEVEVGMPSDSVSAAAAPLSFATSTSVSSGRPTSSHGHTATAGDAAAAAAPTSAPSSVALSQPLIRRVAIFDFDVHHGNGTEAIVRSLVPTEVVTRVSLPFAQGAFSLMSYRPWLGEEDGDDIMFISSHGYGLRDPAAPDSGYFFPGSGASCGWSGEKVAVQWLDGSRSLASSGAPASTTGSCAAAAAAPSSSASATDDARQRLEVPTSTSTSATDDGGHRSSSSNSDRTPSTAQQQQQQALPVPFPPIQTPAGTHSSLSLRTASARPPESLFEGTVRVPSIINVGLTAGTGPEQWRRVMTSDVLPRLDAFKPDIIFISAGFDGHHKDTINWGFLGLREEDYEWITLQLMKIANSHCAGRIVSVLEGGYRIQGAIVSAFSRSVAAHVRALNSGSRATWDTERERCKLAAEMRCQEAAAAAAASVDRLSASPSGTTRGLSSPRKRVATLPLPSPTSTSIPGAAAETSTLIICGDATAAPSSASVAVADAAAGSSSGSTSSSKRRRGGAPVDYAALDAKLRADAAAAAAAAAATAAAPAANV